MASYSQTYTCPVLTSNTNSRLVLINRANNTLISPHVKHRAFTRAIVLSIPIARSSIRIIHIKYSAAITNTPVNLFSRVFTFIADLVVVIAKHNRAISRSRVAGITLIPKISKRDRRLFSTSISISSSNTNRIGKKIYRDIVVLAHNGHKSMAFFISRAIRIVPIAKKNLYRIPLMTNLTVVAHSPQKALTKVLINILSLMGSEHSRPRSLVIRALSTINGNIAMDYNAVIFAENTDPEDTIAGSNPVNEGQPLQSQG